MEDFGLIESNGIRNKDPTRRRASKIFFPLSLSSPQRCVWISQAFPPTKETGRRGEDR